MDTFASLGKQICARLRILFLFLYNKIQTRNLKTNTSTENSAQQQISILQGGLKHLIFMSIWA